MLSKKKLTKNLLAASIAAALLSSGFGLTDLPTAQAKAIPQGFDLESHRGGRDATLPFCPACATTRCAH